MACSRGKTSGVHLGGAGGGLLCALGPERRRHVRSSNAPLFALAAPRPPWGRPHKGFLFGLEDLIVEKLSLEN